MNCHTPIARDLKKEKYLNYIHVKSRLGIYKRSGTLNSSLVRNQQIEIGVTYILVFMENNEK